MNHPELLSDIKRRAVRVAGFNRVSQVAQEMKVAAWKVRTGALRREDLADEIDTWRNLLKDILDAGDSGWTQP